MNRITIAGLAALVVLAVVGSASLFTVSQTQQVLVVQFGKVERAVDEPGLHAKTPFLQNVITFDKRLLAVELPGEEVILGDQRRLALRSDQDGRGEAQARASSEIAEEHEGLMEGVLHAIGSVEARVLGAHGTHHVVIGQDVVDAQALRLQDEGDEVGGVGPELVLRDDGADLHGSILALAPASALGPAVPCGQMRMRESR